MNRSIATMENKRKKKKNRIELLLLLMLMNARRSVVTNLESGATQVFRFGGHKSRFELMQIKTFLNS